MFNTVYIDRDVKNGKVTVTGNFGARLYRSIVKVIPKSKVKYLFITLKVDTIVYYDFFTLEILELFKEILSTGSAYDVNLNAIQDFINKTDEYMESLVKTDKYLNYDNIETRLNFKILEHQKIAFTEYERMKNELGFRGYLLNAATGTGKTGMSLMLAEAIDAQKVVIIAPLPTIDRVWRESIEETVYKKPQNGWYSTDKKIYEHQKHIVCHYENLPRLMDIVKLLKTNNTVVIVDEAHNFNEMKSKRTNMLLDFINELDPSDVILMTGTPIKASVNEMIPMLRILDKRFNSTLEKRFGKIYNSPGYFLKTILPLRFNKLSVKIAKSEMKLKELHTEYLEMTLKDGDKYKLSNIAIDIKAYIAKRKEEILSKGSYYRDTYNAIYAKAKSELLASGHKEKEFKEYEKDFKAVIVAYNKRQLMMYPDLVRRTNAFENDVIMSCLDKPEKDKFRESKTIVKYLSLKLQGEALANVVMRARINCHVDIAKHFNYEAVVNSTTKKTIIFSNYIDVCKSANDSLRKKGYATLNVYGDFTKQLSQIVSKFTTEPKFNPLITTYKSLSTGVPLVVANVIIAMDLPFRTYIYEQAIARSWRLGQDKEVYVYIPELITGDEPNINSRNIDIITFFKKEVETITGHTIDISLEKEGFLSTEDYLDYKHSNQIAMHKPIPTEFNKLSKISVW